MAPKIEDRDILVVDTSLKIKSGAVGAFFYNDNPICNTTLNKAQTKSFAPKIPIVRTIGEILAELNGVMLKR
jgi:hypothetical protein